jgi:hypothetical protein
MVGRQALQIEFLKGAPRPRSDYIRHHRPDGASAAKGCRLMGLPRSTYYDAPPAKADDAETVATITAICNEFEA